MASLDFILALMDVGGLYFRVKSLLRTDDSFLKTTLLLSSVFFAIKVALFIPIFIQEIYLIKYNT